MAAMSDYLESALINHIFRGTAYTAPTTLGIALATTTLSDSDTTLSTKEQTTAATGYARVAVACSSANWTTAGTGGTTSNVNSIVFPTATADWGTISFVAICDNITYNAGNMLFYGALSSAKVVLNGDTFQFNANNLTVQIDN